MNRHAQDLVNAAKITGGTVIVGTGLMANAATRLTLYGAQQGLAAVGKVSKKAAIALRKKEKELANPELYASAQVILSNTKARITGALKPKVAAATA